MNIITCLLIIITICIGNDNKSDSSLSKPVDSSNASNSNSEELKNEKHKFLQICNYIQNDSLVYDFLFEDLKKKENIRILPQDTTVYLFGEFLDSVLVELKFGDTLEYDLFNELRLKENKILKEKSRTFDNSKHLNFLDYTSDLPLTETDYNVILYNLVYDDNILFCEVIRLPSDQRFIGNIRENCRSLLYLFYFDNKSHLVNVEVISITYG